MTRHLWVPMLSVGMLLGIPLRAQSTSFGAQLQLNLPQGSLKETADSRYGFGVGIHWLAELDSKSQLRPRLDYDVYPDFKLVEIHSSLASASAGCDYLYFPAESAQGFFLSGGMAMVRWYADGASNVTRPGLAIGAGIQSGSAYGFEAR